MARRVAWLILGAVVLMGSLGTWIQWELSTPFYQGAREGSFVDVPRGSGTGTIARSLKAAGVLRHEIAFILYVRWHGIEKRLQAGEYRFNAPSTPGAIAQRLAEGDVYYRSVTVPEGLTARETIELIAREGLGDETAMKRLLGRVDWIADLAPRATTLEGFLFPDTYRFSRNATPEDILKVLVDQFRSRFGALLALSPMPEGWDVFRIVTLASLVEKEAGNDEERRLVASVMVNRLRLRMPLACDPTIIYALKLAGTYDGNLRKSDMGLDSLYNTYTRRGLPPGPIANPGSAAIAAALAPAESDYLYYVSRNDGTHQFSKDLRSHIQAVARYQKRSARNP